MRHLKIIAPALLILFCAVYLYAQNDKQGGVIKTDKGVLVVYNEPNNNYTFEIKGDEIVPFPGKRLMFSADGKFLQLMTSRKKEFLKKSQKRDFDDEAILIAHRDWVARHLNSNVKETLKIDSSWQKLSNGTDALLWSYEMPAKEKIQIKKQVYLSVLKGDRVLLLNSAVTDDVNEKTVQQFLIDTLATLKINDKPLSLKTAQEQILKGN